jgi:uncharacterized protein
LSQTESWAVVTGASSGIGREFARLFARNGVSVLLAARSEPELKRFAEELSATYAIKTHTYAGDLSDISVAEGLHEFTLRRQLRVRYLINSAGFGDYGSLTSADWNKLQAMINLNMATLTYLCKIFAEDMHTCGEGRIVNLSSVAGFLSGPNMAVYYATKAYVLHFSEALNEELSAANITVTALCPGPTATGFAAAARADQTSAFKSRLPTPAQVAAYGYRAMLAGKTVAIYGIRNRLLLFLTRFVPRSILTKFTRHLQG